MNVLDIALLAIALVSVVAGIAKGLVREVFALVGVLVGILIGLLVAPAFGGWLQRWIQHDTAAYGVAFVLIFVLVLVVAGLISHLLTRVIRFANLGFVNRLLGGVFGLLRGGLIGLVVVLGLSLFLDPQAPLLHESNLLPRLTWGGKLLLPLIPEGPRDVLKDRLERLPEEELEI